MFPEMESTSSSVVLLGAGCESLHPAPVTVLSLEDVDAAPPEEGEVAVDATALAELGVARYADCPPARRRRPH